VGKKKSGLGRTRLARIKLPKRREKVISSATRGASVREKQVKKHLEEIGDTKRATKEKSRPGGQRQQVGAKVRRRKVARKVRECSGGWLGNCASEEEKRVFDHSSWVIRRRKNLYPKFAQEGKSSRKI